jgi:hypothetical protein
MTPKHEFTGKMDDDCTTCGRSIYDPIHTDGVACGLRKARLQLGLQKIPHGKRSKGEIYAYNTDLQWWLRFKTTHPRDSVEIAVGCIIDKHRDILARFPDNDQAKAMMTRCHIPCTVRGEKPI